MRRAERGPGLGLQGAGKKPAGEGPPAHVTTYLPLPFAAGIGVAAGGAGGGTIDATSAVAIRHCPSAPIERYLIVTLGARLRW